MAGPRRDFFVFPVSCYPPGQTRVAVARSEKFLCVWIELSRESRWGRVLPFGLLRFLLWGVDLWILTLIPDTSIGVPL